MITVIYSFIYFNLCININAMSDTSKTGYSIISWNAAFEKIHESGLEFNEPTNVITKDNCVDIFVYNIQNSVVVIPKYPRRYFSRNKYPAFLFENQSLLDQCIRLNKFPLPEEFIMVHDIEIKRLLDINANYTYFAAYFDSVMQTTFAEKIDLENLEEAFVKLKALKSDFFREKIVMAFSIILSKYIIEIYGGIFVSKGVCTGYSKYYEPWVRGNGFEICIYDFIDVDSNISFTEVYNLIVDRVHKHS